MYHGVGALITIACWKTNHIEQLHMLKLNDSQKLLMKAGALDNHKQWEWEGQLCGVTGTSRPEASSRNKSPHPAIQVCSGKALQAKRVYARGHHVVDCIAPFGGRAHGSVCPSVFGLAESHDH